MRKLIQKIRANRFVSAVLVLMSGTALGQVIGLLTTPIVSRIYTTSAYGEYALFVSVAAILATVSQAGLGSAIMVPDEDHDAKLVFNSAFLFMGAFLCLSIIVLVILSPWVQVFSFGDPYVLSLLALAVHLLFLNASNLLRIFVNRMRMYKVLFWNSIISASATLVITIPLGLLGWGSWGFIIAGIAGNAVCCAQMLARINPFLRICWADFKQVFVTYKKFTFFQLPSNMIETLAQQTPNQILEATFGSASLGSYSMSNKILGIPSRLIASPVNQVYFRTAVDLHDDTKRLAKFSLGLVQKIYLAAAPLIIILIAFGEPVFFFVLGGQWAEAGTIAAMLSFQYVFIFCTTCMSYCRVALNRQGTNLIMSCVSLSVIVLSFVIGICFFDSLLSVLACYAVGSCLVAIADLTLDFICMKSCYAKFLITTVVFVLIVGSLGLLLRFLCG